MKRRRITFKLTKKQSAKVKKMAMKARGKCYFIIAQLEIPDMPYSSDDVVMAKTTLFEDNSARTVHKVIARLVEEEELQQEETK